MELINDVGIFDHFLSDDECDKFIGFFKNKEKKGFVVNRQVGEDSSPTTKKDAAFSINVYEEHSTQLDNFLDNFWKNAWTTYSEKYPTLAMRSCDLLNFKLQKTLPGEGYHVWHDEHQLSYKDSSRVATYIIYLNDDYDAGETEFLSKSMRIQPKKGTLVIFPCNYTHAHRGNPPLTGEKYILTGWVHDIS